MSQEQRSPESAWMDFLENAAKQGEELGSSVESPEASSKIEKEEFYKILSEKDGEFWVYYYLDQGEFLGLEKNEALYLVKNFPGIFEKYIFEHKDQFLGLEFDNEFAEALLGSDLYEVTDLCREYIDLFHDLECEVAWKLVNFLEETENEDIARVVSSFLFVNRENFKILDNELAKKMIGISAWDKRTDEFDDPAEDRENTEPETTPPLGFATFEDMHNGMNEQEFRGLTQSLPQIKYVLLHGEKFGGLHTDLFLYLYKNSFTKKFCDMYIKNFSDLDVSLACKMKPQLVAKHPEIFQENPLQKDFALELISGYNEGILIREINKFIGLDRDVAVQLMCHGFVGFVTRNFELFSGFFLGKEIALEFAEKFKKRATIDFRDLDSFTDLDFEVAQSWLKNPFLADYVVKKPNRFLHGQKLSGETSLQMLESNDPQDVEFILTNHGFVNGGIQFDNKFLQHFCQYEGFLSALAKNFGKYISLFKKFDRDSFLYILEGFVALKMKKRKIPEVSVNEANMFAKALIRQVSQMENIVLDKQIAHLFCKSDFGSVVFQKLDLFPDLWRLYQTLSREHSEIFEVLLENGKLSFLTEEEYCYLDEMIKTDEEEVEIQDEEEEEADHQIDEKDEELNQLIIRYSNIKRVLEEKSLEVSKEDLFVFSQKYGDNEIIFQSLLEKGYSIAHIMEYDWVLNNTTAIEVPENDKFPCEARATAQAAWIVRHAFYLPEGWEMRRLGKILYNRLHARVDTNIHDVTYFLKEFETPETKDGVVYKNLDTEVDLLFGLMNTPESLRTRLPAKKIRYEELFAHQESQMIYEVLLPLAQKGPVSFETLEQEVQSMINNYQEQPHLPKQKDIKTLLEKVDRVLSLMKEKISIEGEKKIPELIQELRHIGQNRTNYVNNVTDWFEKNQSTPRTLLTYAFSNRSLALANGCKDNPRAIKQWADLHALHLSFEKRAREGTLPDNMSVEDLEKYKSWCDELIRCYSGDVTIMALSELKREFNPDFSIPPFKKDLGDGFVGEIFHKNDPRGFTIGFDTGCCMTLGGASASCIHAGYAHKDFGFFALYKDGVLCAQSFLYTNPNFEHILVCDNIEANQGRDRKFIVNKYQTFFQAYCKEQNSFERVHVGTGFTEIGLSDLEKADTIPMPNVDNKYVYTDAETQKLLCTGGAFEKIVTRKMAKKASTQKTEILDEERLRELEKAIPILHAEAKEFFAPLQKEELPKVLEIALATFGSESVHVDEETLREKIEDPKGFPQLISAREEANKIPIGYFFAKETDQRSNEPRFVKSGVSLSEKELRHPLLLITDIVLVPEYQKKGIGTNILLHILKDCRSRPEFKGFHVGFSIEDEMMVNVVKRNERKLTEAGWHIRSFKNDILEGRSYITLSQNSFGESENNGFDDFDMDDDHWGGDDWDDDNMGDNPWDEDQEVE